MARNTDRAPRTPGTSARTTREESLLSEVRSRLTRDERLSARMRRLERMEHAARVWVNGEELGGQRPYPHLSASYD